MKEETGKKEVERKKENLKLLLSLLCFLASILFLCLWVQEGTVKAGEYQKEAANERGGKKRYAARKSEEKKNDWVLEAVFLKELLNKMKLDVQTGEEESFLTVLRENGLLFGTDKVPEKYLTNEKAAIYLARVLELKEEKTEEEKKNHIINLKRIRDLDKAEPEGADALVQLFSLGVFSGKSCGLYSHERWFFPKHRLSLLEMRKMIERTFCKKKRSFISPDGQVIRTKNLPNYARHYNYILESFPNEYYDAPFGVEYCLNPEQYHWKKDYLYPCDIHNMKFKNWYTHYDMDWVLEHYSQKWLEHAVNNVQIRLNFDWRTVDEKWINTLFSSYMHPMYREGRRKELKELEAYVRQAVKNHVVVKGTAKADISSLYWDRTGYYIRVYARYRVLHADQVPESSLEFNKLIFGHLICIPDFKIGKWVSGFYDIRIGSSNPATDGEDMAVSDDGLYVYVMQDKK